MFVKISLVGSAFVFLATSSLAAPVFQTYYLFTAVNGDGAIPEDTPTLVGGKFYGTTVIGGFRNDGMVYRLDPHTGVETPLYSFQGALDGSQPQAGVTGHGGFLYGTTYYGGMGCQHQGCGTVYRVNAMTGAETVLHRFGAKDDGRVPSGGKLLVMAGALYGTTEFGGTAGHGTVFRVDPATGATQVLYSFLGGQDGKRPQGGLFELGGMIYGTTFEGGGAHCSAACGILFRIDPTTGAKTTLYAFTGETDAQYPFGSLAAHGDRLYGTGIYGGATHNGAVFVYDVKRGMESVLYSFKGGHDGAVPGGGLTYDNGYLYGGTLVGGDYGVGVEWRINADTGGETLLHEFTNGVDGGLAYDAPTVLGGYLYGTTYQGGDFNTCQSMGCGTIFKIKAY